MVDRQVKVYQCVTLRDSDKCSLVFRLRTNKKLSMRVFDYILSVIIVRIYRWPTTKLLSQLQTSMDAHNFVHHHSCTVITSLKLHFTDSTSVIRAVVLLSNNFIYWGRCAIYCHHTMARWYTATRLEIWWGMELKMWW